jgi:hypothetical protein
VGALGQTRRDNTGCFCIVTYFSGRQADSEAAYWNSTGAVMQLLRLRQERVMVSGLARDLSGEKNGGDPS